jgi:hypothetical protein
VNSQLFPNPKGCSHFSFLLPDEVQVHTSDEPKTRQPNLISTQGKSLVFPTSRKKRKMLYQTQKLYLRREMPPGIMYFFPSFFLPSLLSLPPLSLSLPLISLSLSPSFPASLSPSFLSFGGIGV